MKRVRHYCFILAALYAASAWAGSPAKPAAVPAPNALPQFGPLNAAQLAQVQAVGQAVLAAKGNVPPASAGEQALLTELHALADSVNRALRLNSGKVTLQLTTPGAGAANVMTATPSSQANDVIAQRVARLHERRAAIDSLPVSGDDARQQAVTHVKTLSQRAGLLEQAAQEALSEPDNSRRHALLLALKRKLQSRNLAEWEQDHDAMAADVADANSAASILRPTPTLTTLTQHRRGLDDLHSKKP